MCVLVALMRRLYVVPYIRRVCPKALFVAASRGKDELHLLGEEEEGNGNHLPFLDISCFEELQEKGDLRLVNVNDYSTGRIDGGTDEMLELPSKPYETQVSKRTSKRLISSLLSSKFIMATGL